MCSKIHAVRIFSTKHLILIENFNIINWFIKYTVLYKIVISLTMFARIILIFSSKTWLVVDFKKREIKKVQRFQIGWISKSTLNTSTGNYTTRKCSNYILSWYAMAWGIVLIKLYVVRIYMLEFIAWLPAFSKKYDLLLQCGLQDPTVDKNSFYLVNISLFDVYLLFESILIKIYRSTNKSPVFDKGWR